jgi:hypothetical protein
MLDRRIVYQNINRSKGFQGSFNCPPHVIRITYISLHKNCLPAGRSDLLSSFRSLCHPIYRYYPSAFFSKPQGDPPSNTLSSPGYQGRSVSQTRRIWRVSL